MKLLLCIALAAAGTAAMAAADQAWDWSTANDEISASPEYASSKAICRQARGREPPAADAPSAAEAASLKGCSSEALYYGIGVKADPVKARQCAFLEIREKRDDAPFSGRTMLMTIYANGVGAKRDFDVATHLACGIEGAPMESHGRVRHLAELKTKGWTGKDFHFCDDITSGLAGGYCASHEADIAGAKRDAELAALTRGWSPADRKAFDAMKKAHAAFAEAHSGGEIDLSGTLRGAFAVAAEERLNDELLAMIKALESGKVPRFSSAQYQAADKALNAGYRAYLASDAVGGDYPGAIDRQGVVAAQRAWLRYRDAFLAFAAIRYPAVPRESLAAWITEKRTKMWQAEQ
jgi:uncharacterized protein YecT (DUF1311 family)